MHTKKQSKWHNFCANLFDIDAQERKKLFYLASCLFFIVAAYSLLRPLKTAIFFGIVGRDFQPYAKWVTIGFTPIVMMLYSKLVDIVRRYQLIFICTLAFALGCFFFAIILTNPVYGLPNTDTDKTRIIGWLFYLLIDFYPILVVTTFWAFSNSISSPDSAKKSYGLIVAASKLSGVISPLLGIALIMFSGLSETLSISCTLVLAGIFLICAGFAVLRLTRCIPGRYLHGYEAVYEVEKLKEKSHAPKTGIWQGFKLMLTEPYVFGIFAMVYSYEIISAIIDYQKDYMASEFYQNRIVDMFTFNLIYTSIWQTLGLFFAVFGTSSLLKKLDVQKCLMLVPLVIGSLIVLLVFLPNLYTIFFIMIIIRALNYGFNVPIREMLYIPTIKDIKFKSKAWTDSFGRTFSKGSGATINVFSQGGTLNQFIASGSVISIGVVTAWTFASYFVAKRYTKTIKDGTVIGEQSDS